MIKIVVDEQHQTYGGCDHVTKTYMIDCPELEEQLRIKETGHSIIYSKVLSVDVVKAPIEAKATLVETCT